MPNTDKEKNLTWRNAYYQKHKERIKEAVKARTKANPSPSRLRAKEWAKNNGERKTASTKASYLKLYANPVRRMLCQAKSRSRTDKREFNIDATDLVLPELCPYLGTEFEQRDSDGKLILQTCYSIDRIDSSKGYVKGNVQVLSVKANRMKSDATISDMIIFATNVLRLYKNG
jgi:hypothetical protein